VRFTDGRRELFLESSGGKLNDTRTCSRLAKNAAKYTCGSGVDADVITEVILKACAEQREIDANICLRHATQDAGVIAAAIRGGA